MHLQSEVESVFLLSSGKPHNLTKFEVEFSTKTPSVISLAKVSNFIQ